MYLQDDKLDCTFKPHKSSKKEDSIYINPKQLMLRAGLLTRTLPTLSWLRPTDMDAKTHFMKHGKDFPSIDNVYDYHDYFVSLTDGPTSGTQSKLVKDKVYFYNATLNVFAVKTANGRYVTMYKPDPSVHKYHTNQAYYDSKR